MFTDHCYQCPSGDSLHSCARFRAKINYHDLAIKYSEAKKCHLNYALCSHRFAYQYCPLAAVGCLDFIV